MAVSSPQHGENTAFSPVFPLAGFMAEAFCWLFPCYFKEKGINHFLWHSHFKRLCLSLWLIQDSNWKRRALWRLSGGLATILQDWISCNEQKMRRPTSPDVERAFIYWFSLKKSATVNLNTAFQQGSIIGNDWCFLSWTPKKRVRICFRHRIRQRLKKALL